MFGFGKGVGQVQTEEEAVLLVKAQKLEQTRRKALEEAREIYAFPKEVPEVGQKVNLICYDPNNKILCLEGSVRCRQNCRDADFILLRITSRRSTYEVVYIPSTGMWWDYKGDNATGSRKEAIVTVLS